MHLHTLVDREQKHSSERVEGVVLIVIQITEDPSAERTAPPRSTHMQPGDVSHALIQQGEKENLRESSGSTTAWWWSLQFSGRASPSTTEEEEVLEEGGAAPGEGGHPVYMRSKGGGGQGEGACPPSQAR